jgi:hypothetical protein
MTIHVTQAHIDAAKVAKESDPKYLPSRCCPVALALKDAGITGYGVGPGALCWLSYREAHQDIPTPETRQFIYDFDAGKPVTPFSFDVELPSTPQEAPR